MAGDRKWILVVDDEAEIRETLIELIKLGFGDSVNIIEARNGAEGTAKINCQMFDCILTDMKMPKKDGKAFVASVRQNAFNEKTPVIVLTGFPDERILEEYNYVYMMKKPFNHQELTDQIKTQLKIGSGGNRMAADMLNNVISATGHFLKQISQAEDFKIDSPQAKSRGQSLDSKYISKVDFQIDKSHNSYSVIASEETLEVLAERMKGSGEKDYNRISYGLGHSVLSYAMRRINKLKMKKVNVESLEGDAVEKYAKSKTGIIIPIQSGELNVRIFASAEVGKAS